MTRNTYTYVNGDPINLTDPTGHRVICDPGAAEHACEAQATAYSNTASDPRSANSQRIRHTADANLASAAALQMNSDSLDAAFAQIASQGSISSLLAPGVSGPSNRPETPAAILNLMGLLRTTEDARLRTVLQDEAKASGDLKREADDKTLYETLVKIDYLTIGTVSDTGTEALEKLSGTAARLGSNLLKSRLGLALEQAGHLGDKSAARIFAQALSRLDASKVAAGLRGISYSLAGGLFIMVVWRVS